MDTPKKRNEISNRYNRGGGGNSRGPMPRNHMPKLREPFQGPSYDPYADIPPELDLRNYTLEEQAAYYPSFGERLLMMNTSRRDVWLPEPSFLDSFDDDIDIDDGGW